MTSASPLLSPLDQAQRIAGLLHHASVETVARAAAVRDACAAPLAPGSDVYITWLPGDVAAERVTAAVNLRRAGFNPVPHIAARHIADPVELRDLLTRLAGEAGVDQALLIGGDVDRPRGVFDSSLDLLRQGGIEECGIRCAGIAAYPEGHSRIPASILYQAIAAKLARLRALGIRPYVVTQFCFEARAILAWLRDFRREFSEIPVHIGLAGPARLATVLKFAVSCGIGNSLRALRRQAKLARIFAEAGPEAIIGEIARHDLRDHVAQLHFFTFGGIVRTAAWLRSIQRGEFSLDDDGLGFRVGVPEPSLG